VYADSLEIDWRDAYRAVVEDLGVRHVRIPVYWSRVEPKRDVYDFSRVDWLMNYSARHDVRVTLVVGQKVPRWPECYVPDWAEGFSDANRDAELFDLIETTVKRHDDAPALERWQVENEPFLSYGICPSPDPTRVRKEIELVRSLDNRPVQVTVSGELETWYDAAHLADVLGISMYRLTWNRLLGYFTYPFTPSFYRLHAMIVAPFTERVVVSELQAEPWFPEPIENRTPAEWARVFGSEDLRRNMDFAQRVGISEIYLWGAEWWYYLKVHDEPELWNTAREIFKDSEVGNIR